MAQLADFVISNFERESGRSGRVEKNPEELRLGRCGEHTVEFLWDRDTGDRCFILVRGEDEFRLRVTLLRSDLEALAVAILKVCEELRADGLLAQSA
jgi:hypothetical protein